MTKVRKFLLDLVERIAKTFLQVFLGQVFVAGTEIGPDQVVNAVQNWSSVERAFVSASAAVVALLMGLLLGWANSGSASALPKRLLPGEAGQVTRWGVVMLVLAVLLVLYAVGFWR